MSEKLSEINWYPGHMKKTKDLLNEQIKLVDLVIEILDARIPNSSRNPEIKTLLKNKKKIVILNKMDLVDKNDFKLWEKYFIEKESALAVIPISTVKGFNISKLKQEIEKQYDEKFEKMKKKGLRKTEIRAMVVGIPNVGKSMFINKVASKSKALVGNKPGFTRGKQWITVNDKFYLLDTPGILWPKFENENISVNLAITGSIKDDILPIEKICIKLIEKMKDFGLYQNITSYYGIEEYEDNYMLLKAIEKRLLIFNNSDHNYEKVAMKILKDYRMGKLGRFFLELP